MPRADGPAEETWEGLTDVERDEVYAGWQGDCVDRYRRDEGWTRRFQVDERTARTAEPEPAHEGQMTLEVAR